MLLDAGVVLMLHLLWTLGPLQPLNLLSLVVRLERGNFKFQRTVILIVRFSSHNCFAKSENSLMQTLFGTWRLKWIHFLPQQMKGRIGFGRVVGINPNSKLIFCWSPAIFQNPFTRPQVFL